MATRKFIEERLQKANDSLTKKQATLARHQKALDKKTKKALESTPFTSYQEAWEHRNDSKAAMEACWIWDEVDSKQEDIANTEKAIADIQKKIEGYDEELRIITEKENSRNVAVIIEFLEMWKASARAWYMELITEYFAEVEHIRSLEYGSPEYKAAYEAHRINCYGVYIKEEYTDLRGRKRMKETKVEDGKFEVIDRYEVRDIEEAIRLLDEDLKREAERKYDDIIERTNSIVGEITDASYLRIDERCNLNGYIIGTKGKAEVHTIGAGGYAIQCFHYRTLIHKMK